MTFRAIVRDGLIVINTHGQLPDGTAVEVLPVTRRSKAKPRPGTSASKRGRSRRTTKAKPARSKVPITALPAVGMWRNRREWKGKTTLEIARELREKALGGRRRD